MAAPVHSIQVALNWSETAIEKDNLFDSIECNYIIAKILFTGKANTKNRKGFRTSVWRAALCAASRKINGRRSAPPAKWLSKFPNVWFWCIYTIPLEPILSKIAEKIQRRDASAPPQSGGYASSKIFFSFKIKKSGARKNKK